MSIQAAGALAKRVLPNHASQILFEETPSPDGKDFYIVSSQPGGIRIQGNSPVSLCAGLGRYLKDIANCSLSWCGSQMDLPASLPPVEKPIKQVMEQKYRGYLNYCTFNYTASWWDWPRWEQEIDFMALNGINLPLSVVGVEGVWYGALREFGFSDEDARSFLCGPAFLAWQWMTNLEGFCGPLPMNWIEKRVALGKKILERELELGMQPIQQGFSGYVPKKLQDLYPEARIQIQKPWCGFPGTAQLDPTDPLFQTFGSLFLKKQQEILGSYGYYAVDPFHEGAPPEDTPEYLQAVGQAIRQLITSFDPEAVWVAQSWSIRREIISVMDREHLLILDLAGTKHTATENFWGYPFVTGNLHNFGGRINLHGDLSLLAENQFYQLHKDAPNLCGSGLFMESIGQNPVYYDLAFDMLTRPEPADLKAWLKAYGRRRYGNDFPAAQEALELLWHTAYSPGTNGVEKSSILCARPAVNVKKSGPNSGFHIPYGNKRLFHALELLLSCGSDTDGYRYDITDILRQVMSNYGQKLYSRVAEAFLNRDVQEFQDLSSEFLELLDDVDTLLSTRKEFRLDQWIAAARSWGVTQDEQDLYEYNACMLLTMWGTPQDSRIFDYGWREWSGLISGYYRQRWAKFFTMLQTKLDAGEEYVEDTLPLVYGREALRANEFYDSLADWEASWIQTPKTFPPDMPDTIETVRNLAAKYGRLI